ncbi:MAG TPA: helix-turn-helix transcriptional regulator [Natronosporangium sp.]
MTDAADQLDPPAGDRRELPAAHRLDLSGALRALRRRADLSQRELAARSGVPHGTVGSVESGASPNPRLRTVERLVAATGARLAILDIDGSEPVRLSTDDWVDEAERRYPPHLDVFPVTWRGTGPATGFGFVRNRVMRDFDRMWAADEWAGPPHPSDPAVAARRHGCAGGDPADR